MRLRRLALVGAIVLAGIWLGLCAFAGITASEWALHPARRPLSEQDSALALRLSQQTGAQLQMVSIRSNDGTTLNGWLFKPVQWNGDAIILLHGQSDNRAGVLGPADMLLRHGYAALLPDARAHGASGGAIATYGVLERDDIRNWFNWLKQTQNPHCIDGLGDSMGAAQLLQSLAVEPEFCAVVAESPFASFREAAYDRMGQQLGTGAWAGRTLLWPAVETGLLYVRTKYGVDLRQASPREAVEHSHVPVLLIHGLKDDNLPPRHSEMILRASHGNVSLWEPANANHVGASSANPQEYEQRVLDWLKIHGTPEGKYK
ncbi:MAG TPA: alpha/beta fold hydrolase [Terracidiphilus sp.]